MALCQQGAYSRQVEHTSQAVLCQRVCFAASYEGVMVPADGTRHIKTLTTV
jgi:hypothetical protein